MGDSKNAPVAQKPVAPAQAGGGDIPVYPVSLNLSDAQVARLERALIYGAALSAFVFNKPNATPTVRNMEQVAAFAEAALEMLG